MSIKPVLVPDHDAATLRKLMDHFSEASTGPTRQQLAESRSAVAAAQKTIREGFMDTVKQAFNDLVVGYPQGTSEGQFIQGWARAIRAETGRDIPLEKLTKLYHDYAERSEEIMQSHGTTNEGVAEGSYKDTSGTFMDRVVGEIMNYQSLNNANPKFADLSSAVKSKLKSLDEIKAKQIYQQALKQAAELSGQQGVAEGSRKAYLKHNNLVDLEPAIGRLKNEFDKFLLTDPEEQQKHQQDVKQRLKTGTMAGPTGQLPEAGRPDVMRHQGDTTVKVVKKAGKPIGEIGIDAEASEGNGSYYVKLYDGSYDAVGFDTAAEALAELKYVIRSSVTEVLGTSPDRLQARTGMNLPHKFPRTGQTNLGNIPGTNLPDSSEQTKKHGQERRANRPYNLKAAIQDQLGKHTRPNLPESGIAEDDVDEGLKQKLAGAALAGAMALGAGGAQAQSTDRFDPAWGTSGYNTSIRSDVSSNKSMNTADPSKDTNDFQKRIQSVTGPNAKGEYKVVVMQGHDIVSHYITKTPPPGWLYKEDAESKTDEGIIDNIKNTVRAANYDRLARRSNSQAVAGGGLAPPAQFRALSTKGDQRAQKAQDIRKGDVAESVDPIEQLRADILRFSR